MPRRRLALLLVLAAGIAVWIAWRYGRDAPWAVPGAGTLRGTEVASPAREQGSAERDDQRAPALLGRAGQDGEEPPPTGIELLALSTKGEPMAGLLVTIRCRGGNQVRAGWTDAAGRVSFPSVPSHCTYDVTLEAPGTSGGTTSVRVRVAGPVATIHLEGGVPIMGRVVDADTGDDIEGVPWALVTGSRLDGKGLPTGRTATCLHSGRNLPAMWYIRLTPPDGYVAHDPKWLKAFVSMRARSLSFHYPLRKRANVAVEVRDPSGARAEAPMVISTGRVREEPDEHGNVVLEGIPYYAGTRVYALAVAHDSLFVWPDPLAEDSPLPVRAATAQAVLPPTSSDWCFIHVRLPRTPRLWSMIRRLIPEEPSPQIMILPEVEESSQEAEGTIHVQVMLQDGEPAADALVGLGDSLRRTGAEGRVVFPDVPSGNYELHLWEPGLVFTSLRFDHVRGSGTWVSLHERTGTQLQVRVIDEEGRPLEHAHLTLIQTYPEVVGAGRRQHPVFWDNEERTVQRLDGFTDARGTRTFHHVDPVPTWVVAQWANLEGRGTARLAEDTTVEVEVVARVAD